VRTSLPRYSPAVPWFKTWQVNIGVDPKKKGMPDVDRKAMPRLMGGAVVGLVAWLAFVVTHSLNTQFEGRKPVLLLINNCLYALTYVVFSGVVAIWR
jgi:UDP-N-acetylmuramyl pentapeptide phosphotransferase/UDP-N-acetylglucosamine-1-phosphate transferase